MLSSPLAVDGWVTCSGTHSLTPTDVDNLERKTLATVTALDDYSYMVDDEAPSMVTFKQVWEIVLDGRNT